MRKKDLNDTELRDIISELMCHVRIGHVLPMDNDTLANAAKRGLISTLPPYMLGEENVVNKGISSWLRGRGTGPYIRPRYFAPYVEETKTILEERISEKREILPNRTSSKQISHIPDTLYMVEKPSSLANVGDIFHAPDHYHLCISSSSGSASACYEDIPAGNNQPQLPILEERILVLMRQREQELKALVLNHRALALVPNRCEVLKLIQLRAVREFGLPDAASDILHGTNTYHITESPEEMASSRLSYVPSEVGSFSIPPPPRPFKRAPKPALPWPDPSAEPPPEASPPAGASLPEPERNPSSNGSAVFAMSRALPTIPSTPLAIPSPSTPVL